MRLKELRKLNNLTQSQIAKTLGVAANTYGSYETGTNQPNIETLITL